MILIVHQNGIADVATHDRRLWEKLHLVQPPRRPRAAAAGRGRAGRRRRRCRSTGLTVRFGSVVAVDDVSMEVRPGEVVGLIGPNGAGKTTLIDAVTGFVPATGGSIALDGQRDRGAERHQAGPARAAPLVPVPRAVRGRQRRGEHPGRQRPARLPAVVGDRPVLARHATTCRSTAVAAVQDFDLEPHLDETPEELPYGRRRLVGIARTVASGPVDRHARRARRRPRRERERRAGPPHPAASPTSATWACSSSSTTSAW